MKEFRECCQWLRDEFFPEEEQIMKTKDGILECQMIVDEMKEVYEGMICTLTPLNVEKGCVKNVGKCDHMELRPQINKMNREMVANVTPPSCAQMNILSMAHIINHTSTLLKSCLV